MDTAGELTRMERPFTPHLFSMTWRDGLFVHWPVDPDRLRPHVPEPLELETYDGRAWLSLLPFVLADAGLRRAPAATRLTVPELNCRTYVRFGGTRGLYFFSIDVDQPLIPLLVGGTTRLPCYAADIRFERRGDTVEFRSVRARPDQPPARFSITYRPVGDPSTPEPGSLDYWLAERRRMYDPVGDDVLYAEIAHDPWVLQAAETTIHENTVFEANGLPVPDGDPRIRYCAERQMTGSIPRWRRGVDGDPSVRPPRLSQR